MKVSMGGVACAIVLGLAAHGPAQAIAEDEGHTFTGQCSYQGVIEFGNPLGAMPEPNSMWFDERGTCTGWLDGRLAQNEPVRLLGAAEGLMSCGEGLPRGPGAMLMGGTRIRFTFAELRVTGAGRTEFAGAGGGSLEGAGATTDDPSLLIERCMPGGGGVDRTAVMGSMAGSISG
ncbi:MAG: hypothetical protein QOE06_2170 [Thermoleophilaceae bacterium]|jgi:hypothetical protein|nr:hypothetical protein [Thermoleophilaceae bacterium]